MTRASTPRPTPAKSNAFAGMAVMTTLWALGSLAAGCSRDDGRGDARTTAAGESIGVSECDDYLKKFDECSARVPALKASMGDRVKQYRDAWKAAAATPQGKESLKSTCKASTETIAASCR